MIFYFFALMYPHEKRRIQTNVIFQMFFPNHFVWYNPSSSNITWNEAEFGKFEKSLTIILHLSVFRDRSSDAFAFLISIVSNNHFVTCETNIFYFSEHDQ